MPTSQDIRDAAYAGNNPALRQLASEGADFNVMDAFGDSLLKEIVSFLCSHNLPFRHEVVRVLLELGANPNMLGPAGLGPLTDAMLHKDTAMLELLLAAGADPNKPCGFSEGESFYDWAESDYRYSLYGDYWTLPEAPTPEEEANEDTWLTFLERIADAYELQRPDHLKVLRAHGALTMSELTARHPPENQ